MLSNWQTGHLGGEGNMRLLELMADQRTVRVHSYSALNDRLIHDADQSFQFSIDEL